MYAEPGRVPREYREDAVAGDALEPGGEATVERTGPELGAPVPPDDPSEVVTP